MPSLVFFSPGWYNPLIKAKGVRSMKRCLVLSDSFKGTLSSPDICRIARSLHIPGWHINALPVADGGEGTTDCFLDACSGQRIALPVSGPFGGTIDGFYGLLPDGTAVVRDDVTLDQGTLRRHGSKLYVIGDVTVPETDDCLDGLEYLVVRGDVKVPKAQLEALETRATEITGKVKLARPKGAEVENKPYVTVTRWMLEQQPTGKTVAFFYITSSGAVNVRKSTDYVAKCVAIAGGNYVSFDESAEDNAQSTINIQMESFYNGAVDADVLIYNSIIDGELHSLDELMALDPLMADFKAVKSGNVWCLTKNFYQESLELSDLILDVNHALNDAPDTAFHFLTRMK